MTIYKALFETPRFIFEAYGETKDDALRALRFGWVRHCGEYDAERQYLDKYWDDVSVVELTLGHCYRDHHDDLTKTKTRKG